MSIVLIALNSILLTVSIGIVKIYQGCYVCLQYTSPDWIYGNDNNSVPDQVLKHWDEFINQLNHFLQFNYVLLFLIVALTIAFFLILLTTKPEEKKQWYDNIPIEAWMIEIIGGVFYFIRTILILLQPKIMQEDSGVLFDYLNEDNGFIMTWNVVMMRKVIGQSVLILFLSIGLYTAIYALCCQIKRKKIASCSLIVRVLNEKANAKKTYLPIRKYQRRRCLFYFIQLSLMIYEAMISYNMYLALEHREELFISDNISFFKMDNDIKVILSLLVPVLIECILAFWYLRKSTLEEEVIKLHAQIKNIVSVQEKTESFDLTTNPFHTDQTLYECGELLTHLEEKVHSLVQSQMKNEKLKVDLLTNISHDLKTPLTSMIGYIDLLLLEEDTLQNHSRTYVEALKEKAENLKHMILRLVDLSKVTSGNLIMKQEELELNRLVIQTLQSMDDIEHTETPIKMNIAKEKLKFIGDGQHLYDAIENLFENAFKYSMKGTRIFISTESICESNNCYVQLKIQNTAAYEIDFTADEIVGRFVRGDKNRTTEGNGLGLAIAKSYVEAMGGKFNVQIEGDTFKTIICFLQK